MFILRVITSTGVEMNQNLGNNYTKVHSEQNPEEFKRTFDSFWGEETGRHASDTFAFVSDENGLLRPLYKNQKSYIMTGEGKTFEHIRS